MREIGLANVGVDSVPNVTGTISGTSGRAVVFVTMLDDLPEIETFQRSGVNLPRRDGRRLFAPGSEIQSSLAAMLIAAEALMASGVKPQHDLIFAAVAREETGLQGMKALYAALKGRSLGFVEVQGDGHEIQYGAGGAIAWWRVIAHGPEGHTTEGGPNVNQAIARAVDAIFSLPHPKRHREQETAVNVGIIESGKVFNHKPATGWFSIDVRSRDRRIVEGIGRDIASLIARVGAAT
jgi:acetylornithine deacetylase/succinyl-diaminopimelate desuccinylase-like protein